MWKPLWGLTVNWGIKYIHLAHVSLSLGFVQVFVVQSTQVKQRLAGSNF